MTEPPADVVVRVDEHDREVGVAPKLAAHRAPGTLHRAVSVMAFDADGRAVLQRRAGVKYHFPGLWANSACTHPRPGESVLAAAGRRVREELGADVTELRAVGSFVYRAEDPETGLVEHEYDHVVTALLAGPPAPDPAEVAEVGYVDLAALRAALRDDPAAYVPWLPGVVALLG